MHFYMRFIESPELKVFRGFELVITANDRCVGQDDDPQPTTTISKNSLKSVKGNTLLHRRLIETVTNNPLKPGLRQGITYTHTLNNSNY